MTRKRDLFLPKPPSWHLDGKAAGYASTASGRMGKSSAKVCRTGTTFSCAGKFMNADLEAGPVRRDTYLLLAKCEAFKLWTEFFPSAQAMKTRKEKTRTHTVYNKFAVQTEQMRLIRCLLYGFVDYNSGKRMKSFDVLTGDQELEVRMATYGSEINQSQHAKSVSHIYNK